MREVAGDGLRDMVMTPKLSEKTEYIHSTAATPQSHQSTGGCLSPPLGGERPCCARFARRVNSSKYGFISTLTK